jgi:hypothetical protein
MLKNLNFNVNLIPFKRVRLEYTFSITDYRHYLYYNFMIKNEQQYNVVLITDVRDVYFQSDPFKADWPQDSLSVAKECREISQEIFNTRWILTKFGSHIYNSLQHKTILCAGTTFGPSKLIVKYLKEMNDNLFYNGYFPWSDQAVHNYLVYSEIVKPVSFADNETGPIMTLALEDDKNILINTDNQILLRNGQIAPIIHQYDRKYELVKLINSLF